MFNRSPMYLHRLGTNDRKRFQFESTGITFNKAKYVLIVITEANYHLHVYLVANLNFAVSLPQRYLSIFKVRSTLSVT